MTPERWVRIEEVFGEALERPGDERAAFLREACAGDEQLLRDVERLLAEQQNPSFRSPVATARAAELPTGALLGRYRVAGKLGQGGMGVVYKAYDTQLRRPVALKVLPAGRLADAESRGRLIREARAASALNHPNIATIYEIGSDRGVNFIAMEFVAGQTLTGVIGRKGLPLQVALKYAVQIASALGAAHGAGIVHRDLKPANIMVNDTGQVKVLDFGLAKRTGRVASEEAGSTHTLEPETSTGTVLGTVAYMSPEQAEGKKLDARSDIFSFGVVLYEMVTGKRAFERDSPAATLAAILKEEPKAPGEVAGGLPPDLERILTRCLRKDPARRFQVMSDLKVELEELKQASESGALEAAAPPKAKGYHRLLWAVGLAVALGAAVAGVWMVRFRTATPETALVPVPLTSYPGGEAYPSFSPDGTQVAFVWCPEGKQCQIYVKQIGVEPPFQLTDSPMVSDSPAWSPDGRTIACARPLSPTREAIVLIPQRGGRERVLAEFDDLRNRRSFMNGPFLAWTPDSKWVAFPVFDPSPSFRERWALFLFSVETGEKRRLTTPPDDRGADMTPAFSPNGRALVFSRGDVTKSALYLLPLAEGYAPGGKPERIASDGVINAGPAWTPNGSEIVFLSAGGGLGIDGLWRVAAVASARPQRLAFASEGADEPAISRQGNRLAYSVFRSDLNIWRIDLAGSSGKPAMPVKFIASTRTDLWPAYSPDGARIAFSSRRSGTLEIWICDSDGSNATQLTSSGPAALRPQWSPGGEHIAFCSGPQGNDDVYVIRANGGAPRRLTTNPAKDRWPGWSRDGKWLYFNSLRVEGGATWETPAAGGEEVRVTPGAGDVPRESLDGKWLYYQKGWPPPMSLWKMPVGGGEEAKVLDAVLDWTVGKEGIYFIAPPDKQGHRNICLQEFATGKIRTIATTDRPTSLGMAVSPDGLRLLYTQVDETGGDLMLVENFR